MGGHGARGQTSHAQPWRAKRSPCAQLAGEASKQNCSAAVSAFPVAVGADPATLIPIAGTQFTKTSEIETPSLRSDTNRASKVHYLPPSFRFPRFARGTARGAPTRFPLRAGGTLRRGSSTPVFCELWLGDWYDKGTSLEFTVCEARTLFRPHPQPLSHCVGEGSRAFPLSRLAGEGAGG